MAENKVMTPQEFYLKVNLKENPFRSNPVYSGDPRMSIWVGYEKQRNDLMKFLMRSLADQVGNINFVMIYGDYGVGKSHALLWARHQITHDQKEQFQSLCYLIPTLRKDKGKLTFAGAFADDLVAKTGLRQDALDYRQFLRFCIGRYQEANGLSASIRDENLIDLLITPVELNRLAKDLYRQETVEQVEALLLSSSETDYQATTTFTRLVNLFVFGIEIKGETRRFRKAVYLMIDELDDLLRASVKEAREINDILRHIYDGCPTCFGLAIALSAEHSNMPAIFEEYILQRIQRQILLEQLGKDDAMEFVLQILETSRIKVDASKKGYFPFEQAAIEAVVSQMRQITPRKIINTMQQVIEEIRLAGFDPSKGKVDLQFLDAHNILDEVLGDGGVV